MEHRSKPTLNSKDLQRIGTSVDFKKNEIYITYMNFIANPFKKLTLLSAAGYIFMFALAAKGVFFIVFQHPPKKNLLLIEGIVKQVRLGGQGNSTYFLIKSDTGTYRYSSYYGKVWSGMERIHPEDPVQIFAERKKLNPNEFISGKAYYIWELVHLNQVIVAYEQVQDMVNETETTVNRYVNGFLAASVVFLLVAYIRKQTILGGK